MAIFRTKTHWFWLVLLLALLVTAPLYWPNYWLSVANLTMITIISVTGLNILTGYCGQLSIGHAVSCGGASASANFAVALDLPFGQPAAGATPPGCGHLFARLRSGSRASIISTLAPIIILGSSATGTARPALQPCGESASISTHLRTSNKIYLILAVAAAAVFFAKNIARTRTGRAL
jgi:branched-chain amino acid transport system permease protein